MTILGSPATSPARPRRALPAQPSRRAAPPNQDVRIAAARALDEYFDAGGRGQPSPDDLMVRRAAKELVDAGLDPAHYARYACMQLRARARRVYPPMVFGRRALDAWVPELRSRAASWAAGPTYECSRERLRLYARRYRYDLLPA